MPAQTATQAHTFPVNLERMVRFANVATVKKTTLILGVLQNALDQEPVLYAHVEYLTRRTPLISLSRVAAISWIDWLEKKSKTKTEK